MTSSRIASLAAAALALTTAAHAQYPKDNAVYKMRCNLLFSQESAIQNGALPPALAGTTKGIPSGQISTFAVDRSKSGDHEVSCALFYMAAMAAKSENKPDEVKNYTVFAHTEHAKANGGSPTISEKLTRGKVEAAEVRKPALTSAQLTAVIAALDVMPIDLAPPPPVPKKKR